MASVYLHGKSWLIQVKDANGKWIKIKTTATSKTEAKALAAEKSRQFWRVAQGLEAERPADGGGTVAELLEWWIKTYVAEPSKRRTESFVLFHFKDTQLAATRLADVRSGMIETFLQGKNDVLSPASINHLRVALSTAFECARKTGRFIATVNPARDVQRRKIPKKLPDYLRAEEVPAVLAALSDRWRPLFAAAIYTGLRKGELLGLTKAAVDLPNRLLNVSNSYDRDTTKGGHGDAIPISAELVPYLETAIASSTSALVFPGPDGGMLSEDTKLQRVLRLALADAGIVLGYSQVCRRRARRGCKGEPIRTATKERLECPNCGMVLWPKPLVRKIRFHDLRHTTGSLLTMAGANPASVQAILRHKDPRTTQIYKHLAPEYLRAEADLLRFK